MTRYVLVLLAALLATALPLCAAPTLEVEAAGPVALSGGPVRLKLDITELEPDEDLETRIFLDGRLVDQRRLGPGEHEITVNAPELAAGRHEVKVEGAGATAELEIRVIPGWLSIVPPLIAIALALIFKDVLVSLFVGVFSGALFLYAWNPFTAFARSIDHFIVPSLADPNNAAIIVFSMLLGGMVGIISKSGGTQGIVDRLSRFATDARRGQLATWTLGVVIFFDDYANTLIVGSTMRPITDRLRISREKLAYIVDSTAAPVASVAPISTWIGFEVGLIAAAFTQLGIGTDYNAYGTFLSSILYRFYPLFALVLGFTIAYTRRDFGPMLKAERRASRTGAVIAEGDTPLAFAAVEKLSPPEGAPRRASNALLPIVTVVVVTLLGLFITGSNGLERTAFDSSFDWLREVFSASDSFSALLWASLAGVVVAGLLALSQGILTVRQTMESMVEGFRSMLLAFLVLILAWSIGAVCEELLTADYVVSLTGGVIAPQWFPALVFLASAAISFATGASWGTMAILMPIVIPISHGLSTAAQFPVGSDSYTLVLVGTISSVLAGSVWGDHCSPISDTTILSSMASGCDHIAHVRTQIPYALGLGILGMMLGDIPTAFGLSPWISLLVGSAVIVLIVRFFGQKVDLPAAP
ncbi:MAG: Na+/H+ antiporter NhaC family protein [Thermoanaerobaculia bacterium]